MKIAVISYDELNTKPSKEQVLSDLFNAFNSSSEESLENMGKVLRNQIRGLIEGNNSAEIVYMDTSDSARRNRLSDYIQTEAPDLLISYNLAGFELETLTDSVLYNLLDCRQFHFINKNNLSNEKYLDKLLSINLFFFRS